MVRPVSRSQDVDLHKVDAPQRRQRLDLPKLMRHDADEEVLEAMAFDKRTSELLQEPCDEVVSAGMGAVEVQEALPDAGQVEAEGVVAAGDVGGVEPEDVGGVEEGAGFGEELAVDEEGA